MPIEDELGSQPPLGFLRKGPAGLGKYLAKDPILRNFSKDSLKKLERGIKAHLKVKTTDQYFA